MNEREDLQKRLEATRQLSWFETSVKRVTRWPGSKRAALRDLIKLSRHSRKTESLEERIEKAKKYFDGLSEAGRQKLWNGLFPQLSEHLERAWIAASRRPYQFGYSRFPFRAPERAETTSANRARFFVLACEALWGIDQNIEWLAAWAPHLPRYFHDPRAVSWILATVLRSGGKDADAVRSILVDSINGQHEIGQMGQHAVIALLNSDQREDWETIGKLLLAAQRQEGLRQSILEAVDEANPDAFRYILNVILENDLSRFSSTVRAFDAWLGMQWAGGSAKVVNDGLRRLRDFFDDDVLCEKTILEGDPEDAYFSLWVTAYQDAEKAVRLAVPLLNDSSPERRFVALKMMEQIALFPECLQLVGSRLISRAEDDPRLQMAMMNFFSCIQFTSVSNELFDATANLFNQLPSTSTKLEPIVWPWSRYTLDRRNVATALQAMAMGSPEKLIPYAQTLSGAGCVWVIKALTGEVRIDGKLLEPKKRKLKPEARLLMLDLMGDARQDVQKAAFEAMAAMPIKDDEVERLFELLHRNAAALRTGAMGRLSKLADAQVIEIAGRLLSEDNVKKRAAGLELASHLVETNRSKKEVFKLLSEHREKLSEQELAKSVNRLLGGEVEAVSLDDCLGLVPPGSRSKLPQPKFVGLHIETEAVKACLNELGEIFLRHSETEIEIKREGASERVLLGSAGWRFPSPESNSDPVADAKARLPLADIWLAWLSERSDDTRDVDGLELVRAWTWTERGGSYTAVLPKAFRGRQAWELQSGFSNLIEWMLVLSNVEGGGEFLVQYMEDALAKDSPSVEEKTEMKERNSSYFKQCSAASRLSIAEGYARRRPSDLNAQSQERCALLAMIALDRKLDGCNEGPSLDLFFVAYDAGSFNEADLLWLLLHPRQGRQWGSSLTFGPIDKVSSLRGMKEIEARPKLAQAVRRMRDRLVTLEMTRGERLTPASLPAAQLRHSGGAEVLFKLITALGKDKIIRQHEWGDPTRAFSFSRLISVTAPHETDSFERFAELYQASGLKPARLLEVTMFAPQWASHTQFALGMEGLEDAVWWVHGHTKQNAYWRDKEFRELWAARINERTALEPDDLEEGAVDVVWFQRIIETVGADGWDRLQKPAKYASNSGGHKRAELFASAMLDRVTVDELMKRIDEKRHQDAVRALGLVPLPSRETEAKAETLRRYKRLQEFKRESRKFGSQRQASEARAVEIGMQNLARTAGYRDPRRLQWAMEAAAVADLARGPVAVTAAETTVSLSISPEGDPELTITKKGRPLSSVPANLRKHEPVAELRSRITELRRQRSRMRLSLEESMCRGDTFTASELQEFFAHPMLRPMVERLVFIGGNTLGYPDKEGRALRSYNGSLEAVGKNDNLRLVYPVDLLKRGDWSKWQSECFEAERVQPFKQIFREVYPKTAAELDGCDLTRRYAGHQVNPRQALALLKTRQWIASPDEGVRKVFHDQQLIAELWFQEYFFTPAEVEDLTLEGVSFFHRKNQFKRLTMAEVPDLIFSEAMRDLDLVVSVAHSGGIDPEASASTIEMRSALLTETSRLLGLANVRLEGHHAIIDGTRASYSVHLGSATTKVLPGRVLLIVAVHSQYRGRLFLPFADDDPKTAEVLSKTILLARDGEIQDSSILEQIR